MVGQRPRINSGSELSPFRLTYETLRPITVEIDWSVEGRVSGESNGETWLNVLLGWVFGFRVSLGTVCRI